jgi:iron-sulfur cluster assembly protein
MERIIDISDGARQELLRLRGGEGGFLRIGVVPGGCSGLSYQLSFDTVQTHFDRTIYEEGGLQVLTDDQSLRYLRGLSIDYSEDLIQTGFRFANPNAALACGCGSSFSV